MLLVLFLLKVSPFFLFDCSFSYLSLCLSVPTHAMFSLFLFNVSYHLPASEVKCCWFVDFCTSCTRPSSLSLSGPVNRYRSQHALHLQWHTIVLEKLKTK
uniref:Uncharacterized protein n=1 Tax=Anopheles darlingi TaxID=43151 RepID=A0A2M4D5F8_ANODA